MKSEQNHLAHENNQLVARIKENQDKIKQNKQLPYLVSNVIEVLKIEPEEEDEQPNCAVIKTSTRTTVFLPIIGLVEPELLKPGELVGVNKDSFLILEQLPNEYDSRVKAMEIDEKPTEEYTDIGGLDKQIEELREAIVLPITHKNLFDSVGIRPPKGVLMYGPPGTGKTMMARACAA